MSSPREQRPRAEGDGEPDPAVRVAHHLPYVVAGIGVVVGPAVLLLEPFPWPTANFVVGGGSLLLAVVAVTYMIVVHGGPGERGPDFR